MKMQNMKIVQKWREYAGPKDERLEAENAKIYEFGFILLSFGMLALLAYEIIAQQVAWVHNGANDAFHLFASPVDAAMYAWLFIVMLICAVLQTRKGYVDTNRFGNREPSRWLLSAHRRHLGCRKRACHCRHAMHCRSANRTVRRHFLGSKSGDRRGFRRYDFRRHVRCAVSGVLRGETSPR